MRKVKIDPINGLIRIKNIARMAEARAAANQSIYYGDIESLCKELAGLIGHLRYVDGYRFDYAILHRSDAPLILQTIDEETP